MTVTFQQAGALVVFAVSFIGIMVARALNVQVDQEFVAIPGAAVFFLLGASSGSTPIKPA